MSIANLLCKTQEALEKQVAELDSARFRMGIVELLNPAEEDHCVQELDDQAPDDGILTLVGILILRRRMRAITRTMPCHHSRSSCVF